MYVHVWSIAYKYTFSIHLIAHARGYDLTYIICTQYLACIGVFERFFKVQIGERCGVFLEDVCCFFDPLGACTQHIVLFLCLFSCLISRARAFSHDHTEMYMYVMYALSETIPSSSSIPKCYGNSLFSVHACGCYINYLLPFFICLKSQIR